MVWGMSEIALGGPVVLREPRPQLAELANRLDLGRPVVASDAGQGVFMQTGQLRDPVLRDAARPHPVADGGENIIDVRGFGHAHIAPHHDVVCQAPHNDGLATPRCGGTLRADVQEPPVSNYRDELHDLVKGVGLSKHHKVIEAEVGNSFGNWMRAKKPNATVRIPTAQAVMRVCLRYAKQQGLDLNVLVESHPILLGLPDLHDFVDAPPEDEPEGNNEMRENHLIHQMLAKAIADQGEVNTAILKALKELSQKIDQFLKVDGQTPDTTRKTVKRAG